jgi:exodeoxyribonuclease V alpha subunit
VEYRGAGGILDRRHDASIDAIFAHHARARLLAVTRQLPTGADALNAYFHQRALDASRLDFRPDFLPGEPVLMRRNDYRRQLFNGDQGVVLRVATEGEPQRFCAVFPARDGYAAFPIDALRAHLELAYALTVHKAQGSEHEVVALVFPHVEQPLLTRELVYTGLTRARRSAVIAAPRRLVARASRSAPRHTRLFAEAEP